MLSAAPLFVQELIPCPDPWDAARKLAHLPHLLFLDSSDRHPERGRYSYVMAAPSDWIDHGGLEQLPKRIESPTAIVEDGLPPFRGGYAGLFGYGLARTLECIPQARVDEFRVPDLAVGRYDWVLAFDHSQNRGWLISQRIDSTRLEEILGIMKRKTFLPERPAGQSLPRRDLTTQFPTRFERVTSNFSRDGFLTAVRRVIEYIHAGDAFQVNLAQRLLAPITDPPLDLYGRLRECSPAPFGCYFDLGEFQIASASPEQFLMANRDGGVVTRPIKGTRPRGRTPREDAAQLHDLTTNPKDRAENVMIVDLLRNDLGRVCTYGSVQVPKVCEVESFHYVHHLVSEVRGTLRRDCNSFDLLRAAFPGGSVTGAPKVRAMEIIAELESTARGPYCGSIGYVGHDGAMNTNILIRTFTAGLGWLQFPVGGGIVADSNPELEYEETLHKAAGLLRALQS